MKLKSILKSVAAVAAIGLGSALAVPPTKSNYAQFKNTVERHRENLENKEQLPTVQPAGSQCRVTAALNVRKVNRQAENSYLRKKFGAGR